MTLLRAVPLSKAWGLLVAISIVGVTTGCGEGTASSSADSDGTGALTGTLRTYVFDLRGGGTRRQRFLEIGDPVTRRVKLTFGGEPDLASGDRVRVWGTASAGELVVDRFDKLPPENGAYDSIESALTSVTPTTVRNAVVLVDVGGGVNLTTASATSLFFSPGKNFAGQYSINSYGGQI